MRQHDTFRKSCGAAAVRHNCDVLLGVDGHRGIKETAIIRRQVSYTDTAFCWMHCDGLLWRQQWHDQLD